MDFCIFYPAIFLDHLFHNKNDKKSGCHFYTRESDSHCNFYRRFFVFGKYMDYFFGGFLQKAWIYNRNAHTFMSIPDYCCTVF